MFNKMVRKQIILLFTVIVICGTSSYYMTSNKTPDKINRSLVVKEEIIEETKFRFKPIIEKEGNFNTVKILIDVTSYIYPHFLSKNYSEEIILEYESLSFSATNWKIIEKNSHRLIGQIEFKIENERIINKFNLKLFFFGNTYEIIWD